MSLKISNIGQLATYNSQTAVVEKLSDVDIIIEGDYIAQIGERLPSTQKIIDASGHLVTPGFVDSHTHPVFAETRESEFKMRAEGKSYQDIAAAGGGIKSSVKSLRRIDEKELVERVIHRMNEFLELGTTTIEAKSGYGLSTESELKSLRVIEQTQKEVSIDILPTFLGAHDFPEEYSENKSAYVGKICNEMIPAIADQGIAEFCDVFCEEGWFNIEDSRRILGVAKNFGLRPRLHANEFKDSGAALLAAEMQAISADHLMFISDEEIRLLAENGVVAVLLPGTTFFLGRTSYAPARELLESGVEIALATDFNPGSSMIQSMPFIMSLACLFMKMTVEEAFRAATFGGAKSLGREKNIGSLQSGKQADLILWNLKELTEIPYRINGNYIGKVFKNGIQVVGRSGVS